MKTLTIELINTWKPCYPAESKLPDGWTGTAIDILNLQNISADDKFWVVCREDVIDARTLRLFAVWCGRQVQHLMTDARSIAALDVAERYADGLATVEELAAARDAALAAVWDAARAAALAAAWAAVWAAAWDARAAWDAVRAAARAARDAAQKKQIEKLKEMILTKKNKNQTL